jgi:cell division protein FtsW (lipid II flippase)
VLASLGSTSRIPPHIGPFLAIVLGLSLVGHLANRWLAPNANPVILPIAALLNGMGYVVIARWEPHLASYQAWWTAVAMGVYVLTLLLVNHTRDLDRYRYLLLLAAVLLLLLPLFPVIGEDVYGARLWVHIGPVSFQPIEIGKLCLCIFFASYFAENKELLSIPTARVGNRLFLDPRPLIPILLAWGFAMLVIAVEDDIGFAMLLFVLFIGMLWVTTGRFAYLVLGIVLFAVGAVAAAHLFPQVHERVTTWLDPWKTQQSSGFQLSRAWYALGTGGVGGSGLGLGYNFQVPEITSDMIFAAIGEELGLLGASVIVMAFLLLVGSGLRIAQTARSDFAKLMATGLTIILGFQAFFIMAGVLRLLPLTGITLPFVAYGGSSLVANYVLVAVLLRVSDESGTAEATAPHEAPELGERSFVAAT